MQWLVKILLPLFISTAETEVKKWAQKFHDANPQLFTQIITAFYPIVDVQLEDYAKATGTQKDDEVVNRLKRVLEQLAAENGITLPNLDAGTAND